MPGLTLFSGTVTAISSWGCFPGSASSLPLRVLCPKGLCLSFRSRTPWHPARPDRTAPQKPSAGATPSDSSTRDITSRRQCPRRRRDAEGYTGGCPPSRLSASLSGTELASAKLGLPEPSREPRLPGPRRKPEHLGDGTAGTRKRLGRTRLAAAEAAGAGGSGRQGSRGTQRAGQPWVPGGAESPPGVRAAGGAAREVSVGRPWGEAGAGQQAAAAAAGRGARGCRWCGGGRRSSGRGRRRKRCAGA